MISKITVGFLIFVQLFLASCWNQTENSDFNSAQIVKQINEQVTAFHTADTSLNAPGVIALLWPEFTMLVDGNRISYKNVQTSTPVFMSSLKTFYTEWKDLKIIPLSQDHAISSFIFTDSLVRRDGSITQSKGPNTFVWEKRNNTWKVIYGDADHYPVGE